MRNILVIIGILVLSNLSVLGANFYFTANEDSNFENPANWSPSFPGNIVREGDKVFIQSDVMIQAEKVIIGGNFDVTLGVNVTATETKIIIEKGGTFNNNGTVRVESIENHATLENAGMIRVNEIKTVKGSINNNGITGEVMIQNNLKNEGTFNNSGTCVVMNQLINLATVNQLYSAKMTVKGTYSQNATAELKKSAKSVFEAAKESVVNATSNTSSSYSTMMFN
ncbi:MAG: hypothetical protein ACKVTZ_00880 [Bacteroidia bacterium]